MKNRIAIIAAATLLLAATVKLGVAKQNAGNAPQQLKVEIDTQQTAQPVSRYEYGIRQVHSSKVIHPAPFRTLGYRGPIARQSNTCRASAANVRTIGLLSFSR